MGFSSGTGPVHERARTNFGRAAQYHHGEAGYGEVVFAVELTVTEARRSILGLAVIG
jgi:hypothetical protein